MIKKRAIFIGDVRFNECNVFELNEETNYFEMLNDREFRYEKEVVEEDSDWLIFEVTTGKNEIDGRAKLID
ncbi:MAG: hypothetical protein N4A57_16620 [Anaeromicrobium sp.]|uniref:hypothetical protein n=1 Tax=Anaeromicrobium sp. TaxID=1929132 RepID=UPI0025E54A08|nr:hypothetical protein [Anaeromicrobium sp.]MCT4595872.1 hypothetical protein [Anaeromicrobium sp.]